MTNTIIWDFNGTILDDLELNFNILKILMERRNLNLISKDDYIEYFCFPIIKFYENLGFDFKKEPFEKVAEEYIELYNKPSLNLPLKEGVSEALHFLKDKNIKQIVLSASNKDFLTQQLTGLKISSFFDEILGLSDSYANSKVSLAKEWIKSANLKTTEIIMIGDTDHDFEVACAIGVKCILVCGGHNSTARLKATGAPVAENVAAIFNMNQNNYL